MEILLMAFSIFKYFHQFELFAYTPGVEETLLWTGIQMGYVREGGGGDSPAITPRGTQT